MKKVTQRLNTPAKIAGFATCIILLIAIIVFAAIQASAGIDENKSIGMDKGINIALEEAGFKAENVKNLSAHYDTDDGFPIYEITFIADGYEYEYVIKASNGKIIEADRNHIDKEPKVTPSSKDSTKENLSSSPATSNSSADSNSSGTSNPSPAKPSSDYIGIDKAKSIALKDAGLSSSSVTFTKAKLDREDGIRVYEIEFFTRDKEYDYEILASSGKIKDRDIESNDDWDDDSDDDDWDDDWDD